MRILCAVGTRPNFIKIAPILHAFGSLRDVHPDLSVRLVHTGQHYDATLSDMFFQDLDIVAPDINLGVGSGSHAEQIGRILLAMEPVLMTERPDLVIVVGDVNSTLACALAASKRGIPVAHIEAGLRCGDRTMPEEINRVLTDRVSDLCFTTCLEATENLLSEGITPESAFFTGNVMIDSLLRNRSRAKPPLFMRSLGLASGNYAVLTLHRPSNVDTPVSAARVLDVIEPALEALPVVFPIHPRTRKLFHLHGLGERLSRMNRLHLVEPLGYLEFLYVMDRARLVLTDSGGIQEETTVLGVPCLTLRENTERDITVKLGTNRLVGLSRTAVTHGVREIMAGRWPSGSLPPLWDGHAAERIVNITVDWFARRKVATDVK